LLDGTIKSIVNGITITLPKGQKHAKNYYDCVHRRTDEMATRRVGYCDYRHGYLPDFDQPLPIIFRFGVYSDLHSTPRLENR
jgi:hypothetical protein